MPSETTTMSEADQIEFDCCGDPGCRCETCPEQKRANALRAQSQTTAPSHTDLMVSPESIDAFLEANPPPGDNQTTEQSAWLASAVRSIIAEAIDFMKTGVEFYGRLFRILVGRMRADD